MVIVMVPLTTNGLVPAPDFPTEFYEAIHRHVVSTWGTHELYEHYAAAWNAVAYRFSAAAQAGDDFIASVGAYGAAPPPDERYRQDKALAEFFSNGFSTFESAFYGLHTIATFIDPASFSLETPKAMRQVSPAQVLAAFKKAFPGDQILAAFDSLFDDAAYREWGEIRNVLTHRTAPGRRMYVGLEGDDAPGTEWKLNGIVIDASMVRSRRSALALALTSLLAAVATFVATRV